MEKHVEILGWLYIVFGVLGLLFGMFFFLFFSGLAVLPDDATGAAVLVIIGLGLGFFFVVTSIPEIIGGYGLLKRKSWSRILVIILGILNLIDIPIGTALGIYTLWVMFKEETTKLFPCGGTS